MSKISDELRRWCESENGTGCGGFVTKKISDELRRWCDKIDPKREGFWNLRELADRIDKELVELPKDADGEVIHIGDRMENNERVVRIVITDGSWEPSVYVEKLPNVLHEYFCNEISHYHEPTVEDVLRAMLDALDVDVCADPDATIAEYAKRLRLVEEDE